jgi:copper chaperone CopZ
MTTVDVVYRYESVPSEAAALALGKLREVYGIRRVDFRATEKTVLVEYDSTRLTESVVRQLVLPGLQPLRRRAESPSPVSPVGAPRGIHRDCIVAASRLVSWLLPSVKFDILDQLSSDNVHP